MSFAKGTGLAPIGLSMVAPKFAGLAMWCALSGIGRTKTYELLGNGTLQAVKCGAKVLIDVDRGLAAIGAMPPAQIGPSGRSAKSKAA